jgi:hypothetical protein
VSTVKQTIRRVESVEAIMEAYWTTQSHSSASGILDAVATGQNSDRVSWGDRVNFLIAVGQEGGRERDYTLRVKARRLMAQMLEHWQRAKCLLPNLLEFWSNPMNCRGLDPDLLGLVESWVDDVVTKRTVKLGDQELLLLDRAMVSTRYFCGMGVRGRSVPASVLPHIYWDVLRVGPPHGESHHPLIWDKWHSLPRDPRSPDWAGVFDRWNAARYRDDRALLVGACINSSLHTHPNVTHFVLRTIYDIDCHLKEFENFGLR